MSSYTRRPTLRSYTRRPTLRQSVASQMSKGQFEYTLNNFKYNYVFDSEESANEKMLAENNKYTTINPLSICYITESSKNDTFNLTINTLFTLNYNSVDKVNFLINKNNKFILVTVNNDYIRRIAGPFNSIFELIQNRAEVKDIDISKLLNTQGQLVDVSSGTVVNGGGKKTMKYKKTNGKKRPKISLTKKRKKV
jgi:hypothetical protein